MNLDKTFCASPQCKNECGRQYTKEVEEAAERLRPNYGVSLMYFCGEEAEKEND